MRGVEYNVSFQSMIGHMRRVLNADTLYFGIGTIRIQKSYTDDEMGQLVSEVDLLTYQWQAKINFDDFKAYYNERHKDDHEADDKPINYTPIQEFHKLKDKGLRWSISIDSMNDANHTAKFLTLQLQKKRVASLYLNTNFPNELMDKIIDACSQSFLRRIHFSKKQLLSDEQAKKLISCMKEFNLNIFNLPGKHLSQQTEKELINLLSNENYFCDVQHASDHYRNLDRVRYSIKAGDFSSLDGLSLQDEDIEKLTDRFTAQDGVSNQSLSLDRGNYTNKKWTLFFKQAIGFVAKKISIGIDPEISLEVLNSIFETIGTSKTIQELTIFRPINWRAVEVLSKALKTNTTLIEASLILRGPMVVEKIVMELQNHPNLNSLILNSSLLANKGDVLKDFLKTNTKIEKLYLADCKMGDNAVEGLSHGLEHNKTLKDLSLSGNPFTDIGLEKLGNALAKNSTLTKIWLVQQKADKSISYTIDGIKKFIPFLSENKSITEISIYSRGKGNEHAAISNKFGLITRRNRLLAHQRLIEKIKQENKCYVIACTLLFQATRQSHKCFKTSALCLKILDFLVPSTKENPEKIKSYTAAIKRTIMENTRKKEEASVLSSLSVSLESL